LLYIERWLKAPMELEDGTLVERTRGTPQGGVISPVLANLFMHYVFDVWMARERPELPWCRYADDGLIHCKTEAEAVTLKAALAARLAECHLELHPEKTKIIYCKDGNRKGIYPNTRFDFLGFCFRPQVKDNRKLDKKFVSFGPEVSSASLKAMRRKIWELKLRKYTQVSLDDIAQKINPIVRGWQNYYGRYRPSALRPLWKYINDTLVAWVMRKYNRYAGSKIRAWVMILSVSKSRPRMFVHWHLSMTARCI